MFDSEISAFNMDTCENNDSCNNLEWKPILRQLYAGSVACMNYFMFGLCLGSTTIVIAQMRREANSSEAITDDMASWISSAASYMGIPWGIILVIISHYIGRKITCFILVLNTFTGFVIFYYSVTITQILISQIIQGMLAAGQTTITVMVATEYTSANYRGVLCTTKSMMQFLGVWAANATGTVLHWRNIGILGMAISVYNFLAVVIMPESPYWLAGKKRFKECSNSHYTLKGTTTDSIKELHDLINSHRVNDLQKKEKDTYKNRCKSLKMQLSQKEVYKPFAISALLLSSYYCSGKIVCAVYAIQIIKGITENESMAYTGMLILDGITILGMITGCVLSKHVKRRTLLLGSFACGTFSLYTIVLYLLLVRFDVILENKYLTILFLTVFSLAISLGTILSLSIYEELIPLKNRGLCTCILSLYSKIILSTCLKMSPYLFSSFGNHGAFLFFALTCTFIVTLMFLYLPETKDKTLLEIAQLFKNEEVKENQELKVLIPVNKPRDGYK